MKKSSKVYRKTVWNKPKRKKQRATKSKPTITYLDNKLLGSGGAWVLLVKQRAKNKCEHCGKTTGLNAHHIYSKSNRALRYDLDNGCCLCVGCHTFSSTFSAHKTPMEFTKWIIETRGQQWADDLEKRAKTPKKWTAPELQKLLETLQQQLKD